MVKRREKTWDFLNRFRGHRNIIELKELFVSMLFLKSLSDQYKVGISFHLQLPDKSKWSFLRRNLLDQNYTLDPLWEAFDILELENTQLRETFNVFGFRTKFRKIEDIDLVHHIFYYISGLTLDSKKYQQLYEESISLFAGYEGKSGEDFTTPEGVSDLMTELSSSIGSTVLDGTCGIGGLFSSILKKYPSKKFRFFGQEMNSSTLALVKLRFIFDIDNQFIFSSAEDTLRNDHFDELKVDNVLMHPPFNLKLRNDYIHHDYSKFQFGIPPRNNANLAWVQYAISHLNDKGKAILLMSNGSLSAGGKEGEIRKRIIEEDLVEAIVTLPSNLLVNTSIPSSLWIINKNKSKKEKVLFIDGSHLGTKLPHGRQRVLDAESINRIVSIYNQWLEQPNYEDLLGFCYSASLAAISKNNYSLIPNRYVGILELLQYDLSNSVEIKEVIEYVRPSGLTTNINYKRITVRNLSSNPDSILLKEDDLTEGELKANFRILGNNTLLISKVGEHLKPTFFRSSQNPIAFSSSSIYAFKVNEELVNIEFLIAELYKDYVIIQLDAVRKGSAMPFLGKEDFLKIKINIPKTINEQIKQLKEERQLRFQSAAIELGYEKEIEKLKEIQMKDLGSKKHNIMQHLNNVKSSVDVLDQLMKINNGQLKADQIIDPRRGVTVEKRFFRLKESLDKVIYYVDNITNEAKFDKAEIINPFKFLKECKERGVQNDLFSVDLILDSGTFEGRAPLISISRNDFEELYNNVLENAIHHGFIDKTKTYLFRITTSFNNKKVEILFENNGKPFPKGITDRIEVKGEKAGSTAQTGIGMWKVSEIVKHFNANMEVIDSPESDFPVGFRFEFNLEIE